MIYLKRVLSINVELYRKDINEYLQAIVRVNEQFKLFSVSKKKGVFT